MEKRASFCVVLVCVGFLSGAISDANRCMNDDQNSLYYQHLSVTVSSEIIFMFGNPWFNIIFINKEHVYINMPAFLVAVCDISFSHSRVSSLLIATKVKTNMCFNSLLFALSYSIQTYTNYFIRYSYLLTTFLQVTLFRYSSHTTIRYFAYNLFMSANLYSVDLYNLQTRNLS